MNAALNQLVTVLATGGTHLGDLCFWSLSDASIVRIDLKSKWKLSGLPPQLLPEPPTIAKAFKLAVRETQVGLADRLLRPVIDNEASIVFAAVHEQKHDDGTLSYTPEPIDNAEVPSPLTRGDGPSHRAARRRRRPEGIARLEGRGERGNTCGNGGDVEKTRPGNPRVTEGFRAVSPVGETGFEPATPWSRTKCSTRLSHSPVIRAAKYRMAAGVSTQLRITTATSFAS